MAVYDPDSAEMKEYTGIDIFVPGPEVEREIDWDKLFHIFVLTGVAFGMTILLTFVMMVPMMAAGLIYVDVVSMTIIIDPIALLVITFAEIGFIFPPLWYIRRNGLSLKSIGISRLGSVKEAVIGLGVGVVVLLANFAVTFLIDLFAGSPGIGDESLFAISSTLEVVIWTLAMFLVVGFSEELLFRGFLQRRMEIYFSTRRSRPQLYALVITSIVFAAMHLDPFGFPTRLVIGLIFGVLAQKRNYSIMAPTMAHGLNNTAVIIIAYLGF